MFACSLSVPSDVVPWVRATGKERQRVTDSSCFQWFHLHWGLLALSLSESQHALESIVGKRGAWSKYSPLCQNVMATLERDPPPADSMWVHVRGEWLEVKRRRGSCRRVIGWLKSCWIMWFWCAVMAGVWSWIKHRCNVEIFMSAIKVTASLNHDARLYVGETVPVFCLCGSKVNQSALKKQSCRCRLIQNVNES